MSSSAGGGSEPSASSLAQAMGRRQHHRVPCDLKAKFRMSGETEDQDARVVNIGLGGLRVDLPVEVAIPADMTMEITFPEEITRGKVEIVSLESRVVWTVTDRIDGPYPTGIQYRDVPDTVRRRLFDLVAELMRA